jgi:hypothetical protein
MNACDPDADIENLRKLIKLNTGVTINLTRKEICEAYQDIQDNKLPLPPMVINSTRTYLVDRKSPLKPNDYEKLFDSTTKRVDLKRIARKVDLKNVEQMTKSQLVDAIGKRLRYMKVHEPVKIARKRRGVSVNNNVNTAVNNTAVNNFNNRVNNANNRVNNTAVNNTAVNTNFNRVNNNVNRLNTNVNRVNTNVNRVNNLNRVNTNVNRVNTNVNRVNTNVNRPANKNSKVTFPTGGLFGKNSKPKFLGGQGKLVAKNNKPKPEKKGGFLSGLFGGGKNKNFIAAKKFKGSKDGYVFRNGEKGLGYYLNTGRVQGPQLPSTYTNQPTPTIVPKNEDFSLELAVARIKQLDLKREQKFLNQIQLGRGKRKDVVVRAEGAKREENEFSSLLDSLNISNTNRNAFKRRMATDDFKQIQVEAKIKADEKANVIRSNEEKMAMFLKTTGLTNTNKTLFLNKARRHGVGEDIDTLIKEARDLDAKKKLEKLSKKQDEFRSILQTYNKLNAADKEALVKGVTETANVNTMRKMADDLVKKRIEEKKSVTAQNLLSFLTPLQINQTKKNDFLRRFRNEDVNINSIKAEALKLQENVGSTKNEALRIKLKKSLGEIGLNQIEQNSIMKKFTNGNRNVDKLIQEAKTLKAQKGASKLAEAKKEYREFINRLPGLTNADITELTQNNSMNRNRAKKMSNKRIEQTKIDNKQEFIKFMTELGITNKYRDDLLDNFNSNQMSANALKNKATKIAQQIKSEKDSKLKSALNTRLDELGLSQVNKNSIMRKFTNGNRNINGLIQEAKSLKSTRNAENMSAKRKEFSEFLNTLPGLTINDKRNLLSTNNRNRNKAKALSNQRIAKQKGDKKAQFEKFLVNLGLNNGDKKKMMEKYNSDTLTVNALQKVAQQLKKERVQQQKSLNKNTLMKYLETADISRNAKINIERRFNTNQGNLRTLQLEVNKMVKDTRNAKIADNKAKLVSKVKGSILSNTNKNAFIRRLNDENANITALRSELNAMVVKIIETQRGKDRDELEEYMKTQGLSSENQRVIISKFNANNKIALDNLKQEANAILTARIQEKRKANTNVLADHGRKLGLTNQEIKNLTNKLNREKLEPLMNEAVAISKKKAQNEKNALNRKKSDYINKIGLNADNKRNILSQNLNFNSTKSLANKMLQNKIIEKRSKNLKKLELHLNTLNLTNDERRKFFNNFNKNVNLTSIMKTATVYETQKKASIKAGQLANLKKFLNEQGLNNGEQRPFLNKFSKNQDDMNALKVDAKKVANKKFADLKAKKRKSLVNSLKKMTNLSQSDINGILKNFDTTNVNTSILANRAKKINKSRKNQKYAQSEEEFYSYLDTLQNLTPANRTEITSKMNGYFTNWNSIKQLATNTAVRRAQERRANEKTDLDRYMTNLGFNNNSKRIFFKNLADGKNLKVVKSNAKAYKVDLDAKRKAVARKEFSSLLNTLYLDKSDRDALLEKFNDETTGLNQLQNNAREKEAKTIDRNRGKLTLYLSDDLKLGSSDVNLLVRNYNQDPKSLNSIRNRGRQLKNARNEEERKEIRKQIREYLNGLNLLNNKNKQNIISKNLSYNNAKNQANKIQEFKKVAKRGSERNTLTNAIKNLSNKDQKDLLNKFNTRNVTLNSMLNEAKDLKVKRIREKRARERNELYGIINSLNMNVADRNTIMNKFDKSNMTVNVLRNEAVKLKNKRSIQKRSQNRGELEDILNKTNLNSSNKTSILNIFNSNKNSTLTSLRATIEELSKRRAVEKRLATRVEVEKYLKKVGLSNANTEMILNKFNADNGISLKDASNEANTIFIQRVAEKTAKNRENLVQHINGLNISNANRAAILKNFDSEAASLNKLKNRATQINTATKAKIAQRNELSDYFKSLNINGTDLLQKYDNGISNPDRLKKEADNIRREMNAVIVNKRKENLTEYMNDTFIPSKNRKAFLNRVKVNTNMNSLKSNIKNMDNSIRSQKEKEAKNRDEFSVFLNGLELTSKDKNNLLKNYNAGRTNKNVIRNRALSINAGVKKKAAQRRELSNYINGTGINGKAILNKFNSGRSTLNKLKKEVDKEKSLANARVVSQKKEDLDKYMKGMRLTNANKKSLINRIKANTNMNAIKSEVKKLNTFAKTRNEDIARKKSELKVYLNTLNDLTNTQRNSFLKLIVNETSNVNKIKLNANALNKSVKEKRAVREAAEEEKKRKEAEAKKIATEKKLQDHLISLKHLTSKEMAEYMLSLKNGKAGINDLITASKAKNADNEKDKDVIRNYVRKASIPQSKKNVYLKQLNAPHVDITPFKGLVNANVATEKAAVEKIVKNVQAKIKKLTDITANERAVLRNRLKTEPAGDILKEAEKIDMNRKAARRAKDKLKKNTAESLRTLTSITRNNRKMFMNRLNKNGQQKVMANATALNKERKDEQARQKKKEEMEKSRLAEELRIKKAREQEMKNVASRLQGLTSIERENRKRFMARLSKNGARKVVANATALNKERKDEQARQKKKEEMEKKMIEDKKKAEEAKKKFEEAKRKSRNRETKRVATRLQGLTSLERENRKKFMNRLATNGSASRVLADAEALNKDRKDSAKRIRNGVKWKLEKIGAQGSNLKALMKRWNNSKNQTIFNEARKKASDKQPLLDKIIREIPGRFGQWRRGWEDAVRKADTPQELRRLDSLLDEKSKLRAEIEKAPIAEDKRRGQLRFVMKMANDVGKRRAELAKDIKDKRDAKDGETRDTATKLQSMNKLGRDNRKRFMDRIAGGESSKMVLKNADKLQRNRTSKQRLEAERKERERQQSQQRKEQVRKTRDYEKQKQAKLRGNTARMLQGMTGLERKNRQEFMRRLNRGEEPSKVISNAQKRSKSAVRYTEKTAVGARTSPRATQPQGRVAPRTKKLRSKNRTRLQVAKQRRGTRK